MGVEVKQCSIEGIEINCGSTKFEVPVTDAEAIRDAIDEFLERRQSPKQGLEAGPAFDVPADYNYETESRVAGSEIPF